MFEIVLGGIVQIVIFAKKLIFAYCVIFIINTLSAGVFINCV